MARYFGGRAPHSGLSRQQKMISGAAITTFFCSFLGVASLLMVRGEAHSELTQPALKVVQSTQGERIGVLVANREIQPNLALHSSMFRIERLPKESLVGRPVTALNQVQGHFSRATLLTNQPLYSEHLSTVRPLEHILDDIPDDFRAVTIRISKTGGVTGWAWPGTYVDVNWIQKRGNETLLTPIVHNAKVLSAERITEEKVNPKMPIPTTVTLLVTKGDANELQLAQHTGTLTLTLRNGRDVDVGEVAVISDRHLGGRKEKEQARPETDGYMMLAGEKFFVTKTGDLVPAKEFETEKE